MIEQGPYAPPTPASSLPGKPRSIFMNWLCWAIALAVLHGLLNWWSISNVSGGFWVMEGGGETPVERFAEVVTLFLNFPGFVFCLVWGFSPFGFIMPVVAIANSCLFGATLALLVVFLRNKKRALNGDLPGT